MLVLFHKIVNYLHIDCVLVVGSLVHSFTHSISSLTWVREKYFFFFSFFQTLHWPCRHAVHYPWEEKDVVNGMIIFWKQINSNLEPITCRGCNLSWHCTGMSIYIFLVEMPMGMCCSTFKKEHYSFRTVFSSSHRGTFSSTLFTQASTDQHYPTTASSVTDPTTSTRNDSHLNVSSHLSSGKGEAWGAHLYFCPSLQSV